MCLQVLSLVFSLFYSAYCHPQEIYMKCKYLFRLFNQWQSESQSHNMYLMSGLCKTVSFVSDVCPGPDVSLGKQNQLVSCGTWYYWFCFIPRLSLPQQQRTKRIKTMSLLIRTQI